eukprot:TRINITY_DN39221_c0_g1_i1.p2 TRINITY_DN39221_c0_g1~~TRINITY_DN39221_c0_g1_i1.p2  ORF type:complete len:109 (-),score=6.62 TRINITY_DN39221_c0_g1_i1:83-409(-)
MTGLFFKHLSVAARLSNSLEGGFEDFESDFDQHCSPFLIEAFVGSIGKILLQLAWKDHIFITNSVSEAAKSGNSCLNKNLSGSLFSSSFSNTCTTFMRSMFSRASSCN